MKHTVTPLCLLALVPSAAPAERAYSSDEGHQYAWTCNEDGIEFESLYPVARQVGHGAGRQMVVGIETFFLGRSCDAQHPLFGAGEWCRANGGFWARFPDHEIGFGGAELFCQEGQVQPEIGECRC